VRATDLTAREFEWRALAGCSDDSGDGLVTDRKLLMAKTLAA
jgi:hypothetical protein